MNYIFEYIWLDISGQPRSKIRVLNLDVKNITLNDIPEWSYDGSSTGQRETRNSEVILIPIRHWNKTPTHIYVLCKGRDNNNNTVAGYWQDYAETQFSRVVDTHPWFGVEQEFFIFDEYNNIIVEEKAGQHYCGVGYASPTERNIMNDFLMEALDLGLHVSGINQEVAPGQWEYQIGPVEGIEAAHELYMAKYLICKVAEKYECRICFDAKINKTQNGSGCHVNISTKETRENIDAMFVISERMKEGHVEFIKEYCGNGVEKRLTGSHETSHIGHLSIGVSNRAASIRIPQQVWSDKKGYFEDRRPCSNIDYYKTLGKYCDYF